MSHTHDWWCLLFVLSGYPTGILIGMLFDPPEWFERRRKG